MLTANNFMEDIDGICDDYSAKWTHKNHQNLCDSVYPYKMIMTQDKIIDDQLQDR